MARMKKLVEVAVAAALFAGCAGAVVAADAGAAIAARKAAMKTTLTATVKLRNPAMTAEDARGAGKIIAADLKTFNANLGAGTGPESGVVTKAKAEIWTDKAGFKAEYDKALAAANALSKVGDDPAAAKAASKAVLDGCTSCHTKYRST